jgi:xanthine/CO dehydrogenase XdhC/CoxF family maturation factor
VVIMTHDHPLDDAVLEAAARQNASDVGLGIGALSPEEIAVSIVAERVMLRHGRPAARLERALSAARFERALSDA